MPGAELIDQPRTLRSTCGVEGDASRQSLITLSFKDLDQRTELTLRQEGLGSAVNRHHHHWGWSAQQT
jgi:hypothetical protein